MQRVAPAPTTSPMMYAIRILFILVFLSLVKGCGLEGQRIPRLGLLCMESLAF
jgi:hypothetical protein